MKSQPMKWICTKKIKRNKIIQRKEYMENSNIKNFRLTTQSFIHFIQIMIKIWKGH